MSIDEPSTIEKYYINIIEKNNTKLEELFKQNQELKSQIKLLQWRLHEQD